jgi:hypothetical protein
MKDMMGGSYRAAVRRSLVPEWLSMNFMMAGMFPTMVVLMMGRDMRAMEPTQLAFWGAMSAAVLVGLIVAYPVNVWMVAKGLKHGMGTQRALGKGGHTIEAEHARWTEAELAGEAARCTSMAAATSRRKRPEGPGPKGGRITRPDRSRPATAG